MAERALFGGVRIPLPPAALPHAWCARLHPQAPGAAAHTTPLEALSAAMAAQEQPAAGQAQGQAQVQGQASAGAGETPAVPPTRQAGTGSESESGRVDGEGVLLLGRLLGNVAREPGEQRYRTVRGRVDGDRRAGGEAKRVLVVVPSANGHEGILPEQRQPCCATGSTPSLLRRQRSACHTFVVHMPAACRFQACGLTHGRALDTAHASSLPGSAFPPCPPPPVTRS